MRSATPWPRRTVKRSVPRRLAERSKPALCGIGHWHHHGGLDQAKRKGGSRMRATKEAARSTVDLPTERVVQPARGSLSRNRPDVQQGWLLGISLAARGLGALSVLAVGAVHLQQYLWLYSAIPTIGTLFLLTFVSATVIGLALLLPIERWAGRWGRPVVVLVTLGGIALA